MLFPAEIIPIDRNSLELRKKWEAEGKTGRGPALWTAALRLLVCLPDAFPGVSSSSFLECGVAVF